MQFYNLNIFSFIYKRIVFLFRSIISYVDIHTFGEFWVHLEHPGDLFEEKWHLVMPGQSKKSFQQLSRGIHLYRSFKVPSTLTTLGHVVLGHLPALATGQVLQAVTHELSLHGVNQHAFNILCVVAGLALWISTDKLVFLLSLLYEGLCRDQYPCSGCRSCR